jgi:hypothetical protein
MGASSPPRACHAPSSQTRRFASQAVVSGGGRPDPRCGKGRSAWVKGRGSNTGAMPRRRDQGCHSWRQRLRHDLRRPSSQRCRRSCHRSRAGRWRGRARTRERPAPRSGSCGGNAARSDVEKEAAWERTSLGRKEGTARRGRPRTKRKVVKKVDWRERAAKRPQNARPRGSARLGLRRPTPQRPRVVG